MHRFRLTSGKCCQVKAWQMLYIRSMTMQYLEWILCISRVSSNSQDTNHRQIEEYVLTQLLSLNAYSVWSSLEVIIIITCTLGRISRLSKARVRAHGNQSALCANCASIPFVSQNIVSNGFTVLFESLALNRSIHSVIGWGFINKELCLEHPYYYRCRI